MKEMRRIARLAFLVAFALVLAAAAVSCGGDDDDDGNGNGNGGGSALADCNASIGGMAPITGDAAAIGEEQLNFMKFGVQKYNEENGTNFQLVEGDTQLDPAQASTVGQRFVSNDDILAVVGPAGSQEISAVGPIFTRANIGFVSPSATATDLTNGDFPSFFRVVPTDADQGPTIADFIEANLNAETVYVIDDQSSYSTGLAKSATDALEEKGITVQRESVSQKQSDFSALVSTVKDADVVFLPWQLANKAQVFSQQLKEQGSDAVIFGSDGLFSDDFTQQGAYVASFAPDVKAIESSQELVQEYQQAFGEFASTFGPPAYAATRVVAEAIGRACEQSDNQPSRDDVVTEIGATDTPDSILGQPVSFDEMGDVEGAKFFIFQVQGKGKYELQQ